MQREEDDIPALKSGSLSASLLLKIDEWQCFSHWRKDTGDVISCAAEQMLPLSACKSPSGIFCSLINSLFLALTCGI